MHTGEMLWLLVCACLATPQAVNKLIKACLGIPLSEKQANP